MKFMAFLHVLGWVLAGFAALFASIVGYLFATGGFEPIVIEAESFYFEYSDITIDEDTDIFVFPLPEDTTELDITLSIQDGNSIISIPTEAKINEAITITVLKDGDGKNVGGVANIKAYQGVMLAECTIFVDVPIDSFELIASDDNGIYVGENFTVTPTNMYPANSLNPSADDTSYNVPDKIIKYYSNNEQVATVDELTGEVTPIAEGTFEIEANVIKTYNLDTYENSLEYYRIIDPEYGEVDYWDFLETISVSVTQEFTVESIAVEGMSYDNNASEPLYDIYMHQTITFSPEDFGMELLPQPDSNFTTEQLSYKLKDVVMTPMHYELGVLVENPNITITILEDPLRYELTVLNFETWQTKQTHIHLYYSEEIQGDIHFRVLQNQVESIEIIPNSGDAIEIVMVDSQANTIDLESITNIIAVDDTKPATYTTLRYRIDIGQRTNDEDEIIIECNSISGILPSNLISPISRGTTRIKAFIVETDIYGEPILFGDDSYNILFEMPEYVTVNVLENLTSLDMQLKDNKEQSAFIGEIINVTLTDLTQEQVNNIISGQLLVYSADETAATVTNQVLNEELYELHFEVTPLLTGKTKIFIVDNITENLIDYLTVNGMAGVAESTYDFDFNLNEPSKTSIIRGQEAFLVLSPNSHGAFVDAFKYDKVTFESNQPDKIELTATIDEFNNIIVRLVAINFDPDPAYSFSMIRTYLNSDQANYLFNLRVDVDLGAVNGINLHVNNQAIEAIPSEDETDWLTPESEEFTAWVTFADPENPAVTGVEYISSDESVLEIDYDDLDAFGNPAFIFKRSGNITLTAKSLDPYAIPTDPTDEISRAKGAYAEKALTVTVPNLTAEYNYEDINDNFTHEKVIAGDTIDLLLEEVGIDFDPRVKVIRDDNQVDVPSIIDFEIVDAGQSLQAATLVEIPASEGVDRQIKIITEELGLLTQITIRLYTDFGWEEEFLIEIIPNLVTDIEQVMTYPGDILPEVIYPDVDSNPIVDLEALEVGDLGDQPRVYVEDLDGTQITNITYTLTESGANDFITAGGELHVYEVAQDTSITVKVTVVFDSGINFEKYYYLVAKPNIEIITTYNNPYNYGGQDYEEISLSFDLTSRITANSVDGNNTDISDTLNFAIVGGSDYVQINSSTGMLQSTGTQMDTDQYLIIRVYTDYNYEAYYYVKVLAP